MADHAATTLPLPQVYRQDPPANVMKSLGDLKAQCAQWKPTPLPEGAPHTLLPATVAAGVCDQVTGDRDTVHDANMLGVLEGVIVALLVVAAYRAVAEVFEGFAGMILRAAARRKGGRIRT